MHNTIDQLCHVIRLFRKEQSGATAIEFSLLALPFALTIIAIVELSMFFATTTVLEGALHEATRLIRTGELQKEESLEDMEELFVETVCNHARMLTKCSSIEYEVRKLDSFSSDISFSVDDDGHFSNPEFLADDITAGCVALLRLGYLYDFITPFFGTLWSDYPDSKRLIVTTTVVKSEPYNFNVEDNCDIG